MEHTPEDEILVLALNAAYNALDRGQGSRRVHIKLGWHATLSTLSAACFSDALQHPTIAPIVGCGAIADQRLWTATAIPDGVNLFDALARGPLPPDEVTRLICQVASALEHAHARGAVHRTLTTRTITFRIDGGSSVSVAGWTDGLIDPSACARTVFTAPEMGRGGATDGRVDVYALGVIAYRALTEESPPAGISEVRGVTTELSGLIIDMLAPVPRYRPTSDVVRSRAEAQLGIPSSDLIQTYRPQLRFKKPKWTPPIASVRSGEIVTGEIHPAEPDTRKR